MFDFVSKRKWFFLVSVVVILGGIISMIVYGLNVGLDFRSGITMTLVFEERAAQEELRASFADMGYPEAVIQHSPKEAFLLQGLGTDEKDQLVDDLEVSFDTTIRIAEFKSEGNVTTPALMIGKSIDPGDLSSALTDLGYPDVTFKQATLDSFLVRIGEREQQESEEAVASVTVQEEVRQYLEADFGSVHYLDFDSISAAVASERVKYTGYAVVAAALGILLYIAWSFRRMDNPFRFGVCAIVTLVHDALIVLGVFSLFRLEVNSMFIIAVLTVIGYGVNNIIVVFDRIRENRLRSLGTDLDTIVNVSITGTLTRSLNTSLTTLFVLLALFLFGGTTIHNFVLALIVGVVSATYSSLFVAPELLVSWERGELGRFFSWIPFRTSQQR
ncbi:MAG: protein translocase subunit SecF [Dehalococcoidia bacterium]